MCIAIPDHGLGLAIKVSTASEAVRPMAVMAILQRYFPGFVAEDIPERWKLVTNHVGTTVGAYTARFEG
jgi:L-asparaginase II